MRIAYLINQYPTVSHNFVRREILALERQGFEILRIALRGWDRDLIHREDELERKRTRYVLREGVMSLFVAVVYVLITRPVRLLHALRVTWRLGHRAERPFPVHLAYLAEACKIESWLRAKGIEHLHAHFGTNSAEVAMLVHALGGPPWSFTVHGPEEFEKAPLIRLAEKIRDCSFVVAVSSYGRSQLYRLVDHMHWSKVRVVHCGLENSYHAVPALLEPAARRLICVGRLCEQKGQLLLVEAARQLAKLKVDFELVFAGDGELRADIEALIRRYRLQDRTRITGWISEERVREEISNARALVLPSFAEGLPVVIMEAMALRRPVISTFVAGIPELVLDGKNGWLVPPGDVEALTSAMKVCLDTPTDVLTHMGEAGCERVLARHDQDMEAAKLATLFRDPELGKSVRAN
jgi:glycosyltransferase involved in cell wall biosynthesis